MSRVERNLLAMFRRVASARESGDVLELPGVSIASAGVAFSMFNAAFLSEPAAELESRMVAAALHFGARRQRWAFWVCEERLAEPLRPKAQALFHGSGLGLVLRHPGMLAERLLPPARPLPALDIRPVRTVEDRLAFCHINAVAFQIPFAWCQEVYEVERLWSGDFSGYLGNAGGQPVTTAATMVAAGAAGLYGVATLPEHRGKGYAEAVIRHAVGEAGIERSILQACAAALPLYRRLGYEVVAHFSVYST